jgi:hypothetical protein
VHAVSREGGQGGHLRHLLGAGAGGVRATAHDSHSPWHTLCTPSCAVLLLPAQSGPGKESDVPVQLQRRLLSHAKRVAKAIAEAEAEAEAAAAAAAAAADAADQEEGAAADVAEAAAAAGDGAADGVAADAGSGAEDDAEVNDNDGDTGRHAMR